tara:strand:- start:99 stop:380 length:282 start_codon:yes stop_codon:yes gene_type:complete
MDQLNIQLGQHQSKQGNATSYCTYRGNSDKKWRHGYRDRRSGAHRNRHSQPTAQYAAKLFPQQVIADCNANMLVIRNKQFVDALKSAVGNVHQ